MMKNAKKTMNLKFFGENGKDFFTNAFNEAYNIGEGDIEDTEVPSDAPETIETSSDEQVEQIPTQQEQEPVKPSKEEIKAMYEEYYGTPNENPVEKEVDPNTESALELYKYLEENPHLVQAMRDVDAKGYEKLNSYVPDELNKKVQELEEFIQEQKYNNYISELKNKFSDFDENKVLEYAEQHEVYDLEVAYKALKADSVKEPNMEELRKQIKEELLNELKQNSLNTQSVIGAQTQKPINNGDEVSLTSREQRIARAMGMSPSEYSKWR